MNAIAKENRLLRQELAGALDRNADYERIAAALSGFVGIATRKSNFYKNCLP